MAVIVVLVDGVGVASETEHNVVAAGFPKLSDLLGEPLVARHSKTSASQHWRPIDATLGVAGLPQSGTGHTAIWGGYNAAALNGRHQPSYPTIAMRERLVTHNLLRAAQDRGKRVAWVNAYLPGYDAAVTARRLRHTAGTWAAINAGLPLRGVTELLAGTALAWDIDQRLARMRPGCEQLPVITPEDGGARLVRLAQEYDLVAFETYLPDLAGHGRLLLDPLAALHIVDGFLAGVIATLNPDDTLVVTSDHGNVEDMTTRVHTRNPVPLLVWGPAVAKFEQVMAIDQIMAAVLASL